MFNYFANPKRLDRIFNFLLKGILSLSVMIVSYGLFLSLFASPLDYQQKDAVRIMYVHVPAAWLSLGIYFFMSLANLSGLIWRHVTAFMLAKSASIVGATFTLICLVTGSIWGKPMWGTWWVWDARLTSVFILFLLYAGYITITANKNNDEKSLRAAALLNIFGAINLPIIKWSVNWWNTLHQPASVSKLSSPAIHPEMLKPLLIMFVGLGLFAAYLIIINYKVNVHNRKKVIKSLMDQIRKKEQLKKSSKDSKEAA